MVPCTKSPHYCGHFVLRHQHCGYRSSKYTFNTPPPINKLVIVLYFAFIDSGSIKLSIIFQLLSKNRPKNWWRILEQIKAQIVTIDHKLPLNEVVCIYLGRPQDLYGLYTQNMTTKPFKITDCMVDLNKAIIEFPKLSYLHYLGVLAVKNYSLPIHEHSDPISDFN